MTDPISMKNQPAFLKAKTSPEENEGSWYRKKPTTRNQTNKPSLVNSNQANKPSLVNSKSQERPKTLESQKVIGSLFQWKSHTEKLNSKKMPTPNPNSFFGKKTKDGFHQDQRNLKVYAFFIQIIRA